MDEKERLRLTRKLWKLNGLCSSCGRPNTEIHGPTCTMCRERWVARRINRLLNRPLVCAYCPNPKADNSKRHCVICLEKFRVNNLLRTHSQYGKWAHNVRRDSGTVAKGCNGRQASLTSHLLPWTHQDFCKAFPCFKESGKQLDHIIPLACAESSPGQLDEEFGKLVVRLENLQLLTSSENNKKAFNIERQMKARAIALRQQGKHGAELFHQLWAEFAYPQRQEEGNQDALPND